MLRQMIGLVGTVLLSLTSFAHANPCQLGIKEPAMPWLPPIFKVRFLVGGAMLIAILMASSVGLCASPPVATDDAFTVTGTPEGVTCRLLCLFPNGPNVLDNDTDADGDPLTAILVSGASHGRLCLFASGEADYCPDPTSAAPTSLPTRPATVP